MNDQYIVSENRVVTNCGLCGHLLNVYLNKKKAIPEKVALIIFEGKSTGFEDKYWECAECLEI